MSYQNYQNNQFAAKQHYQNQFNLTNQQNSNGNPHWGLPELATKIRISQIPSRWEETEEFLWLGGAGVRALCASVGAAPPAAGGAGGPDRHAVLRAQHSLNRPASLAAFSAPSRQSKSPQINLIWPPAVGAQGAWFQAIPSKVSDLDGTDESVYSSWDQYCLSKAACVLYTQVPTCPPA